jgi:hypothetical protein
MRLMKGITIAGVSSLVVAMSYGCSSTTTIVDTTDSGSNGTDSGVKPPKDSGSGNETGPGQDSGSGVCGPLDTTGYTPRAYSPPSGAHQKKCTTQNLTDYVACITGADKTKCAQFGMGMPAAMCGACIETQATDATWGPLVSPDGKVLSFNVPGCLDLVVPNTQCGKSLDASYGCQDASCSACDNTTTPNFSNCVQSALKKQCKTYGDTVTTACAAQFGDAAPKDINNCFPDQSIADPKAQQADWISRIATYFCGP